MITADSARNISGETPFVMIWSLVTGFFFAVSTAVHTAAQST